MGLAPMAQAQEDAVQGQALLEALDALSYDAKAEAIEAIIVSGDERSRRWLDELLGGKLQRHKDTGRFVIVLENRGRNWPVVDALTFGTPARCRVEI
jgi:urea transport system permease protein